MVSFKFQSPTLKIEDFKINHINTVNPNSNKGEALFFKNLSLGQSFNKSYMLCFKFTVLALKLRIFKLTLLTLLTLLATKSRLIFLNLFLGKSQNQSQMLSFKFQSPSFKIEDFQINPINPISNKGRLNFLNPLLGKS